VQSFAADLLASGEVAGKSFETNLLHKPSGLKAKRLLLISGGKREEVLQLRFAASGWSGRARAQVTRNP